MKRLLPLSLLLSSLCLCQTIYVSPSGQAGWSGRLAAPNANSTDGPLPSLEAARDAVRKIKAKGTGPINVLVRKGTYRLENPFVLTPEDSGTPQRPINYAAYPGERPEICGARVIQGWKKTEGPDWSAEAPANWQFRQMFVNGARAIRARTPNYGFYRAQGPSSQDKPFKLAFRGDEIKSEWAGSGAEVIGYLAWADYRMPIVSVDQNARIATLGTDPRKSNREADARYYIENAPGTLDMQGEWYHDSKRGVVLYRPTSTDDMASAVVLAPVARQLLRMEGRPETGAFIRNVTFRGLTFCHTDWQIGPEGVANRQGATEREVGPKKYPPTPVVDAIGVEDSNFENCKFLHHGDYPIWFGRGSKRNRIVRNEMFDLGAGAVLIGESAGRQNEAERTQGNIITDNHFHHMGLVFPTAVGIWVGQSSNNTIAHNHVHDLFYSAISVGWTWGYAANQCKGNRIDYNHLHNIGFGVLSDMGAIYTLGDQAGATIRNNLIHDVNAFTYGGWGIYTDEGSTGILIENNIVYRCKNAGFHQHYGRENIIRNNVFAFNREYQLMRTRLEKHTPFIFERNIVYFDQGRLLGTRWLDDQLKMNRNVYFDTRGEDVRFSGMTFKEWQAKGNDKGSLVADPLFVDPGAYNFKLRPNSPALKLGFKSIDMSTVGPRPAIAQRPSR